MIHKKNYVRRTIDIYHDDTAGILNFAAWYTVKMFHGTDSLEFPPRQMRDNDWVNEWEFSSVLLLVNSFLVVTHTREPFLFVDILSSLSLSSEMHHLNNWLTYRLFTVHRYEKSLFVSFLRNFFDWP